MTIRWNCCGLSTRRARSAVCSRNRVSRGCICSRARRQWHRLPLAARELVLLAEMVTDSPRKEEPLRAAVALHRGKLHSNRPANRRTAVPPKRNCSRPPSHRRWNWHVVSASKDATPASSLTPEERAQLRRAGIFALRSEHASYHWVSREYHSIDLLREVYGNPYRHVQFHSSWRTHDVKMLAIGMYSRGDFSAMPYLADLPKKAFATTKTS